MAFDTVASSVLKHHSLCPNAAVNKSENREMAHGPCGLPACVVTVRRGPLAVASTVLIHMTHERKTLTPSGPQSALRLPESEKSQSRSRRA